MKYPIDPSTAKRDVWILRRLESERSVRPVWAGSFGYWRGNRNVSTHRFSIPIGVGKRGAQAVWVRSGLMIARGLAENGAKVYIAGRRKDVLERVKEKLVGVRGQVVE